MRAWSRAVLTAVLLLSLAVPAVSASETPGEDPDEPVFVETPVWLKPGDTPAGNLAGFDLDERASWNEEEPTQSVTEGAGGGQLALPANTATLAVDEGDEGIRTGMWTGTFTGDLDNLAIELYLFQPVSNVFEPILLFNHQAVVTLLIDGEIVYGSMGAGDDPGDELPLEAAGDAVWRASFAIDGIYDVMKSLERWGMETGTDVEHEITLILDPVYTDVSNSIYVYDTTEVPSGIVFNAPELAGASVFKANG